jgi:hypothetical protein
MIPQVHDNERQPEEQAPFPLEEKGTTTSTAWWQSKNLLQRVIALLVLFAVGLVAPTSTNAVGAGFFAVLGAAWFDSWWACLFVPVALVAGSAMRQLAGTGLELDYTVLLALSACAGAILGTAFFKWKKIRQWMKGASR